MPYCIFKNKGRELIEMWNDKDVAQFRCDEMKKDSPRSKFRVEFVPEFKRYKKNS